MKENNIASKLLLAGLFILSSSPISAEMLTVKEFEQKQLEIMQSEMSKAKQLEEIQELIALYKANAELANLINPPKIEVPEFTEEEVAADQASIKVSELQNQQGDRIKRMRELIATNDSGMYMSEYFEVGNFIQASFIVNGKIRKDVNVKDAISSKRPFGNYRIIDVVDNDVIVLNTKTNRRQTLILQSPTEVLNEIEFANEVTREYAKSIVMGELDVELQNQGGDSTNSTFLDVNYPTMNTSPTPFDSLSK
ncbi:hypothetical protein [Vibrio sp. R78045]|uniref:hypothetical protein n=1 Tax=Vibrio sp. R78045 TaxID=3093868 RepID=UPI0036F44EB0